MATFFETPSREGLRKILKDNLGEFNELDFKGDYSITGKIAKQILALANSGGGALIFGVSQDENGILSSDGIKILQDKTDIEKSIAKFLPQYLSYEILDFTYTASEYAKIIGKNFQVIIVEDKIEYLPFVSKSESDGIKKDTIYIRRNTNCEPVNYEELQKILNRRIESGYSTSSQLSLAEHCEQLKLLFMQIEKGTMKTVHFTEAYGLVRLSKTLQQIMGDKDEFVPNPKYPKEDYDDFILRMIELKKNTIEKILKSV